MELTFCGIATVESFNISTPSLRKITPLPPLSFSRSWPCQRFGSCSSSTTPKLPAHTRSFRVPFPISKKVCLCLLLSSLQYRQSSISKQSFIMRSSPYLANRPRITAPWVNSQASRPVLTASTPSFLTAPNSATTCEKDYIIFSTMRP